MRMAVLLAVLALAAPSRAGTIAGRIQVTDKGGRPARDLTEAVVWVEGAKSRPRPGRASMSMRSKAFVPHVLSVPLGSTVDFPNEDPILHNVFSVSGENRFDLQLYKRPKSGSWTFQKPGVVRVYCNIHPQMSAVVLVTDSPHAAKVGADGSFRLEGVPPGRYTLRAWHERGGEASLPLEVMGEGEVGAQLVLDASSFKRVQHKNKFGKDYSGDEKY